MSRHKKKLAFLFSAMRHFAEGLRGQGWTVDHVEFDNPANPGSFSGEIRPAIKKHTRECVVVTEPGEWRAREVIENMEYRNFL